METGKLLGHSQSGVPDHEEFKENSSGKRKAREIEGDLYTHNARKKVMFHYSEQVFEEDYSLQDLDEMLERCKQDLDNIDIKEFDMCIVNDALDIAHAKAGISRPCISQADITREIKKLETEKNHLGRVDSERNMQMRESERIAKENSLKLTAAKNELEKAERELELTKYSEVNSRKVGKEYLELFENLGISVESSDNTFKIRTVQENIEFEPTGSQKYKMLSTSSHSMYKGPQAIYSSEMFYIIQRLLINSK